MQEIMYVLDKLGKISASTNSINFSMRSFNDRLYFQKLFFILTEISDSIEYNFNWYLRGPYSSTLANDLFSIERMKGKNINIKYILEKNELLNKELGISVERLKEFCENFNHEFSKEWKSDDLEVLASLIFISKYIIPHEDYSKEYVLKEFAERKPYLNDNTEKYWKLLRNWDLVEA